MDKFEKLDLYHIKQENNHLAYEHLGVNLAQGTLKEE